MKLENDVKFNEAELPQQERARDIFGMFDVVSVAPTGVPKNFQKQIKIYTNGATYRLYWYDHVANVWHFVTATA